MLYGREFDGSVLSVLYLVQVWCVVLLCFVLGLPMLHSYVAFAAITSVGVIGLYISYLGEGHCCSNSFVQTHSVFVDGCALHICLPCERACYIYFGNAAFVLSDSLAFQPWASKIVDRGLPTPACYALVFLVLPQSPSLCACWCVRISSHVVPSTWAGGASPSPQSPSAGPYLPAAFSSCPRSYLSQQRYAPARASCLVVCPSCCHGGVLHCV